MSKQFRYSKKRLETMAELINSFTKHKVNLFFSQGCGVYVEIDGKEYNHYMKKDNAYIGLKNKEVAKLLDQFFDEVREGAKRKDIL